MTTCEESEPRRCYHVVTNKRTCCGIDCFHCSKQATKAVKTLPRSNIDPHRPGIQRADAKTVTFLKDREITITLGNQTSPMKAVETDPPGLTNLLRSISLFQRTANRRIRQSRPFNTNGRLYKRYSPINIQ